MLRRKARLLNAWDSRSRGLVGKCAACSHEADDNQATIMAGER
jgi:hypothetical protein